MAYTHVALEDSELGPMVQKMVAPNAPAPLRKALAMGAAPLPPGDLLRGLYQLWVINDPDLATTAAKTLEGLPEPVLKAVLNDPKASPGLLDLMARKMTKRPQIMEALVRHPAIDDESIAAIARSCSEELCEVISDNQERWLAFPEIIVSLYNNANCRMSLIHRIFELAERQGVEVKMHGIEELRQALKESEIDESRDEMFKSVMGGASKSTVADEQEEVDDAMVNALLSTPSDGMELPTAEGAALLGEEKEGDILSSLDHGAPEKEDAQVEDKSRRLQQIMQMSPMEKIRAGLLGDKYDRSVLIRDSNKVVAMATIKSPKISDSEAVSYSTNRSLNPDVIRYIANRKEWTKLYQIKLNLVMNPKTPLNRAMVLLAHLHRSDVAKVARSKNIASALAQSAKRKMAARR